jgi:hypothetical protein
MEIFDAPDFDVRFTLLIVAFDRCCVGSALVDRYLLRLAVLADRLAQEAQRRFATPLGRPKEIDRRTRFVDRPIQIFQQL